MAHHSPARERKNTETQNLAGERKVCVGGLPRQERVLEAGVAEGPRRAEPAAKVAVAHTAGFRAFTW